MLPIARAVLWSHRSELVSSGAKWCEGTNGHIDCPGGPSAAVTLEGRCHLPPELTEPAVPRDLQQKDVQLHSVALFARLRPSRAIAGLHHDSLQTLEGQSGGQP